MTLVLACALAAYANENSVIQPADSAPSPNGGSWLSSLWNFPIFQFLAPLFESAEAPPPAIPPAEATAVPQFIAPCSVVPLDQIEDPAAGQLEASVELGNVVDVSDMNPAAARALDRFESRIEAVGGSMVLKSAYRPASYQQHLQNVWYKWMDELRDNTDPACQDLRAQVQDEFSRHHLIETQHPVAVSDHTRGLAFDATVELPMKARLGRRRITLDSLARVAGLVRPAILADPVHFKYIGGGGSWNRRRQRNG